MEGRVYTINEGQELRFQGVDKPEARIVLQLEEGRCEVFGSPLEAGREYTLPRASKAALASVGGPCKVRFANPGVLKQVAEQPNSGAVYNDLLASLNARRAEGTGPNILICGQTDTGKSTLCKYLLNSAVKAGHSVCFLDCDLGQNSVTCPGNIAAVFLEDEPIDVEEGLSLLMPLAFFVGDLTLNTDNLGKYNHLCSQAGACIRANAENRPKFKSGGLVVNTMGWVEDLGYSALKLIVDSVQIDFVIVMGNPTLEERMRAECAPGTQVVGFARSEGVVERHRQYRKDQRNERIVEYFNGINAMLRPVKVVMPFSELYLFQVGTPAHTDAPSNLPPYHTPVAVLPDPGLNLSLAAVSHASCKEEIAHANVAGFVLILSVDMETQQFTLLLPSGNCLPRRFLIVSKIHASLAELQ